MATNSNIEWTDHTFNPWTGCTKVSPGCANCYAEGWAKRSGIVQWGYGQPRRRTSEANWKLPLKWNRDAAREWVNYTAAVAAGAGYPGAAPRRPRVFCASLADWLDQEVPIEWLADLLELIHLTPHLDWLLLTKRPQNWRGRLVAASVRMLRDVGEPEDEYSDEAYSFVKHWLLGNRPPNVWIGTTVENQEMANQRIPDLLEIPAQVRFLSCEPLLGPVDLRHVRIGDNQWFPFQHLHWVICGGESGPKARPMHPDWARGLRDQCRAAEVPFLFKQWGEYAPCDPPVVTNIKGGFSATSSWKAKARYVGDVATGVWAQRVGKKAAGRMIDGREWNDFPAV